MHVGPGPWLAHGRHRRAFIVSLLDILPSYFLTLLLIFSLVHMFVSHFISLNKVGDYIYILYADNNLGLKSNLLDYLWN